MRSHLSTWSAACLLLGASASQAAKAPGDAAGNEPKAAGDHSQQRPAGTTGNASFYASRFSGRKTASGERYDPGALTAAHRTLPLGTRVRVTNPKNQRSVIVKINDRGPVPNNRMIDVSSAAADQLGMKNAGVTRVRTEVVGTPEVPEATR